MKLHRKDGFTLVEVIFTMVLLSLFMVALLQVFNITYKGYQHNRLLAGKMYAKSNIDGLFNIIEEELKYSGSQNKALNALFGLTSSDDVKAIKVDDSGNSDSITTKYALAEKIVLTHAYPEPEDDVYLALFEAQLPVSRIKDENDGTTAIEDYEGLWTLTYDDLVNPTDADPAKLRAYKRDDDTKINEKQGVELTFNSGDTPLDYVSPIIYESSFGLSSGSVISSIHIDENDKKEWYGEIIYKTRIYHSADDKMIRMEREIPTIDKTYTINILDSVESFNITENSNVYQIEIVYFVPGFEDATFTKSRTFNDWSAD